MADTLEVGSGLTGDSVDRNKHFIPDLSSVLDIVLKVRNELKQRTKAKISLL